MFAKNLFACIESFVEMKFAYLPTLWSDTHMADIRITDSQCKSPLNILNCEPSRARVSWFHDIK